MAERQVPQKFERHYTAPQASGVAEFIKRDIDIKRYGWVIEADARSEGDARILIQEAGRNAYDDDQLTTFQEKAENNVAAFAKHARLVHIYNFDAGDEDDNEAPKTKIVTRSRRNDADFGDLGEVEAVNGVLLDPGQTLGKALRDAFSDPRCLVADVRPPLKHTYSTRLKFVSDIEQRAAQRHANVAYTWIPIWDYNMPTQRDVDAFVQEYSRQSPGTTTVFHCGAGIGRSGLFILAARWVDLKKQGKELPKTWEELGTLLHNTYRRSENEVRICGSRKLKSLFNMLKSAPI